jgi:hypothetical protein
MSRRGWIILLLLAVAAAAYYFTLGGGRASEVCTVCIALQGRTQCPTAAAGTPAEAVERAKEQACDRLTTTAEGRAQCLALPPTSVRCRTR